MRDTSKLDAAVIAYREDPTEANRACTMAAMIEHNERFMAEQTAEFQSRTGVTR